MTFEELFNSLEEEIKTIHDDSFTIDITESNNIPSYDNSALTFANFDSKNQKVIKIKTAILFIDIRKSSKISLESDADNLVKLYSSFTRSMIRVAEFYQGKVRSIIGDRIMVVFEYASCGQDSVKTAVAMTEIIKLLNKHFKQAYLKCGIGIDAGEVLVSKCGIIKRGSENSHYKELTWSGTIANTASKLTDKANKTISKSTIIDGAQIGYTKSTLLGGGLRWEFMPSKELIDKLKDGTTFSPRINFPNPSFSTLFHTTKTSYESFTFPPILITDAVINEIKLEDDWETFLKQLGLIKIDKKIEDVTKQIFGIK